MAAANRLPVRAPPGGLVVLDQPHRTTPTATGCREREEEVEAALETLQDKEEPFPTCRSRIRPSTRQESLP